MADHGLASGKTFSLFSGNRIFLPYINLTAYPGERQICLDEFDRTDYFRGSEDIIIC
jgi:hypothetical protein